MSRTYRRKNTTRVGWATTLEYHTSDFVKTESGWQWVPYPKDSKEYKKGYAKYHGDHGTHNFKEPGPSWFRNLFSTRPERRKAKRELHKYMMNDEYEPMIDSKGKLPYWT